MILIENQTSFQENNKNGSSFLLDKIRFDFSDKVALKLLSLKLTPGDILNSVPECIDLMSDCIYHSAIVNLNQMEEDIKSLAEQRNLPGWNFCNFFLTKESKALSLVDLGLFSEALVCYDELDALFLELISSESSHESDASFRFEYFSPDNSFVSGSDLHSSNWTRYRKLLHQNQISLYEFQIYLFSKQIHILLELNNYVTIIKRCKEFVCRSFFKERTESELRKKWVFQVIFSVLKISEAGLSKVGLSSELANILADILILADAKVLLLVSIIC